MAPLIWFLFLVPLSNQDCDVQHGVQNENTSLDVYNNQIIEYDSSCRKSTIRTLCVNNTFISNVWSCTKSEVHEEVCTYATEPRSWDFKCDLAKFYELLPYFLNNTWDNTYWFPAKRFMKYGPYEFAAWGLSYGKNVADNLKISYENIENVFEKDCLIQDSLKKTIIPEYCTAKHRHNCSFSKDDQHKFCSSNCVHCTDSYRCISNISNEYCSEPITTSTSLPFAEKYFRDDACSVCFKRFDYCRDRVNMALSFKESRKRLYLVIYSTECLYGKGDPDYIYCFTDASQELKKRLNVQVEFNSTSHSFSDTHSYVVYKVSLEDYMGNYWCEANAPNHHTYKSNSIIAYRLRKGREFAVRLVINNVCNYTNCSSTNDLNFIIDDIRIPIESSGFSKIRMMKIIEFHNESFAEVLYHVSTLSRKPGVLADYHKLLGILQDLPDYIELIYCKSSEFCLPETYHNLTWPFAKRFKTVLPDQFCIQSNGLPVTRFCGGDFLFGLNWGPVEGECFNTDYFNQDTKLLHSFMNHNISEHILNNVNEIVRTGNLTLIDLYFVSQILDKTSEGNININISVLDATLNIIDGLLKKDSNLLSTAQDMLNLTDSYLRVTDFAAVNLTQAVFNSTLKKDTVIVHLFNPILQNASGFALYNNLSIKKIPLEGNFDDIEEIHNIKLALYVPKQDIQIITTHNLTNVSIVAVIYLNDFLFPCDSNSTTNLVVNLNIPNYETYLQSPVPLLVNSDLYPNANFSCAFWDYGDSNEEKKGEWSDYGSYYDGKFNNHSNLQVCSYSHLTHLALLVTDGKNNATSDNVHDDILTLITAVGSILSSFGIFGIFLTAFMFRSWRDKTGTQILMHLSTATLLEIIFMYMNGTKLFDCKIAGCILHYVILSKFAWMLIYAFCQYLRFIRVFGPMPNHLVLKSIIFGWGFGIIPVLSVILYNPVVYYNEKFCYPNGIYLYLGVYLPVAVILIVNLFIFCKIMREVTNSKFDEVHSGTLKVQQIRLGILLFSVLGIPWIFGLASNVITVGWIKIIFLYIFVTTSILQGFLMFLFYVIFNKETRDLWVRTLFHEKKKYHMFSSRKSQSVTSIS